MYCGLRTHPSVSLNRVQVRRVRKNERHVQPFEFLNSVLSTGIARGLRRDALMAIISLYSVRYDEKGLKQLGCHDGIKVEGKIKIHDM